MIKRLSVLLSILCLCVADVGWAASKTSQTVGSNIYYLRADGTAATVTDAVGPDTDPSKCMSVATHNAGTFVPGDTIYLSDKGGTFKQSIIAPSSGADDNPIIYAAAPGEHPVIDLSVNVGSSGWTGPDSNGVYTKAGDGRVLWEDGVPLHPATNPSCTDGNWFYQIGSGMLQYKPTSGTPADHNIQTMWFESGWSPYGIDIRNRSNIEISGLTLNYCGIGHGQNLKAPVSLIKNIKIHDNTINHAMWGIWGVVAANSVEQDVEIYNNTINYCNSGISTWVSSDTTVGHTQHPLRQNIHNNTINHLAMLDSAHSWSYGLLKSYYYTDHEGISFQDPMDCTVSDNYILCDTNENLADSQYWTRAIYFFLTQNTASETSGNKVLRNRIVGNYHPAIYVSGYPSTGGFENNTYALNVVQCDKTDNNCQAFQVNFYGTTNPATGINYWVNNTINYPNAWGFIYIPSAIGYWTFENNITVSNNGVVIIPDSPATNHFVFDHNNYYSPSSAPFNHATLTQWQTLSQYHFDTTGSYLQDPKLNSDSAITVNSPADCLSGGTPIEGVTVVSGVGQTGIGGKTFDITNPAMGAYAQPVNDDKPN